MIQNLVVDVESRTAQGKNAARRLRRAGRVPAILYGLDRPPFPIAVDPKRIDEVLRSESGKNTIFNLSLAGQDKTRAVMIKDLQRDPVSGAMVHVDFVRVDLERTVQVQVPVRLVGTADGVKTQGGTLEFVLRDVGVECLPAIIPEHLELDVTSLQINQHLSVGDLRPSEGVRLLDDPDSIIVVIAPPRVEAAPVVEEVEAAPAEPEVVKKGKETPEEGGGAKA
jgi:large subunit ribosomal protein L25